MGVSEPDRAATLLAYEGWTTRREGTHLVVEGASDPAAVTRALALAGLYVHELTPVVPDLESVFLDLTTHEQLGAPPTSRASRWGGRK